MRRASRLISLRMRPRTREISRASAFSVALILLVILDITGCASMQEEKGPMFVVSEGDRAALVALEESIVPLERVAVPADVSRARKAASSLKARTVLDADFQARLAAWSGRLSLLEGKPIEAERSYREAQAFVPVVGPSAVLGIRLAGDAEKRLAACDALERRFGQLPEALVERGRALLELGRYREAVAAFDTAFPELLPIYRRTWGPERDRAWAARDLADGTVGSMATLAAERVLTWQGALTLARDGTKLIEFATGGKKAVPARQLVKPLLDAGILPAGFTADSLEAPLRREAAAWFLWRLAARRSGDVSSLERYSRYLSVSGDPSPIPDVPVSSPFFDAIMGSVESEFLSLVDGRRFDPEGTVNGAEFFAALQRVEEGTYR